MQCAAHIPQVAADGLIDPATKEKIALALVRSGRDFSDAAAVAGLPTATVIRLWQESNTPH